MRRWIALGLLLLLTAGLALPAAAERLTDQQLYSYFNGSVFIGDSITAQLLVFVREKQKKEPEFFAGAKFMTAQSYSLYTASRKNLMSDAINLKYQGSEMPMCRILQKMNPRRALILLGVNDYIGEKIEKGVGYCERILDLTAEFAPDTQIIFQSLTPVTVSFCRKKDYRTMWDQYNEALKAMCGERGTPYVDIATPLKNADGYLDKAFSSDGKYHLNEKGLQIWIDVLLDFAQEQYDKGLWVPEETL